MRLTPYNLLVKRPFCKALCAYRTAPVSLCQEVEMRVELRAGGVCGVQGPVQKQSRANPDAQPARTFGAALQGSHAAVNVVSQKLFLDT